MRKYFLFIFFYLSLLATSCVNTNTAHERDLVTEQMRSSIDATQNDIEHLRSNIQNQQTDLDLIHDKLNHHERGLENVSQQLHDQYSSQQKLQIQRLNEIEKQIALLQKAQDGIVKDLRQFKSHADSTNATLKQLHDTIQQFEHRLADRDKKIDQLRSHIDALMRLLQEPEPSAKSSSLTANSNGEKIYKVKPGDFLEKIAKANGTTAEKIKEANKLSSDKIVAGQKLIIPTE